MIQLFFFDGPVSVSRPRPPLLRRDSTSAHPPLTRFTLCSGTSPFVLQCVSHAARDRWRCMEAGFWDQRGPETGTLRGYTHTRAKARPRLRPHCMLKEASSLPESCPATPYNAVSLLLSPPSLPKIPRFSFEPQVQSLY